MRRHRRAAAAVAAVVVVALAAGGAAVARSAGSSEQHVGRGAAAKAARGALAAVPGGTVVEVERNDGDGPGAYEVELRRPDRTSVDVRLSARFAALGTVADEDGGASDTGAESDSGG